MAKVIVRNISAGFVDASGFHPIRSAGDYDPDRAGDEYSQRPKRKAKKAVKKSKGKKAVKKAANKKVGKRNPVRAAKMPIPKGIPRGKFVLARFNSNGTVSVAVPAKRNPVDKPDSHVVWTYRDGRGILRALTGRVIGAGPGGVVFKSDGGQPGFPRGKTIGPVPKSEIKFTNRRGN